MLTRNQTLLPTAAQHADCEKGSNPRAGPQLSSQSVSSHRLRRLRRCFFQQVAQHLPLLTTQQHLQLFRHFSYNSGCWRRAWLRVWTGICQDIHEHGLHAARTKAAKDEEAEARTQDLLAYPAVSTNFVTLNRKGASQPKPMPNRTLLKAPGH